ncbi:MAG: transcription repressor NadR [Firmicutes bacterium]|nr:transcription repressor NadR [Bacillota bacterium]
MSKAQRRAEIMEYLRKASGPTTGSWLSSALGVTRQVIVGDIAVLRAGGEKIVATPQGYFLYSADHFRPYKGTVAVKHSNDLEEIAEELNLIVDQGGTVVDVTVEHPLYGELTANLQLSTRDDVAQFVQKMDRMEAEPLLVLTGGYHLHGIEAPDDEAMEKIRHALRKAGFLAE